MKPKISGFKPSSLSRKDYAFHKTYTEEDESEIVPLGRTAEGYPLVYQGGSAGCVPATVTWIAQWMESERPDLSWEWLANVSGTEADGTVPSAVLDAARKFGIAIDLQGTDAEKHKIRRYSFLRSFDLRSLYQAMRQCPIMVGLKDFQGVGPHMMAGIDITPDFQLVCVNWWNPEKQETVTIPIDGNIIFAATFNNIPSNVEINNIRFDMLDVLISKALVLARRLDLKKTLLALGAAGLLLSGSLFNPADKPVDVPTEETKFGSAGVVARYRTSLSASIQSNVTSFGVSSATLQPTGETVTTSSFQFPVYLTINPGGGTNEDVECWGYSNLRWNDCYRGLSAIGGNTTSTVAGAAFAHAAGETVIMSNHPYFFNRFVDNFSSQRIAGTKTFTSNLAVSSTQLTLGDGTTGQQKVIFDLGQGTANPFLYAIGTTTTGWSPDGVSTFEFNTAGTILGASSTRGIFLTNSLIGVNASSTASDNGGFLNFVTSTNALGELFWDVLSFLAKPWTWAGLQTFNGGIVATSTSLGLTFTPTSTTDATNKGYVESTVTYGAATGTAGIAISAGQAVFVSATGTLFLADADAASSTYQFVGIALEGGASSTVIRYSRPGETNCNQSGLSPGYSYYLSGTAGAIATTGGTFQAKVGRALNASCLLVEPPKFIRSGSLTASSVTTVFQETGFYPARIVIRAGSAGVGGQTGGMSVGDDTNNCVLYSGSSGAAGYSAKAWRTVNTAGTANQGTVLSKSATGFILDIDAAAGAADIFWTAYSE